MEMEDSGNVLIKESIGFPVKSTEQQAACISKLYRFNLTVDLVFASGVVSLPCQQLITTSSTTPS